MKLDFDIVTSGEEVDFDLASGGQQVDFELSNVQVVNVGGGGSGDVDLSAYQKKRDNNLETDSKTIVGAINEVHGEVDELSKEIPSDEEIKEIVADEIPEWVGSTKPTYTYEEIENTPVLSTVATSGIYSDLFGKPTLVEKVGATVNGQQLTISLKDGKNVVVNSTSVKLPTTSGGGGETPDSSGYIKFENVSQYGLNNANNEISLKTANDYGVKVDDSTSKNIAIASATEAEIKAKSSHYKPIVPANLEDAMRVGVSDNSKGLSDKESTSAIEWLGISDNNEGLDSGFGTDATIIGAINALLNRVKKLEGHHPPETDPKMYIVPIQLVNDTEVKPTEDIAKSVGGKDIVDGVYTITTPSSESYIYFLIPETKNFKSIIINTFGESLNSGIILQDYSIYIDGLKYKVYRNLNPLNPNVSLSFDIKFE